MSFSILIFTFYIISMLTLKAQSRKLVGRKTKALREQGLIPAVVYGHGFKSKSIQVPYLEFEKIFKQVGESSIINLVIDTVKPQPQPKAGLPQDEKAGPPLAEIKVLIHDIQYHALTNQIQHIDFYKIKADEKITVEVELEFISEAPAVKELSGVLFNNLDKVEIECLPENLIHKIEVDISKLKTFDDIIRVKDLNVPQGIKILKDLSEMVIQVQRPRAEEVPVEKPQPEAGLTPEADTASMTQAEEPVEKEEQAKTEQARKKS